MARITFNPSFADNLGGFQAAYDNGSLTNERYDESILKFPLHDQSDQRYPHSMLIFINENQYRVSEGSTDTYIDSDGNVQDQVSTVNRLNSGGTGNITQQLQRPTRRIKTAIELYTPSFMQYQEASEYTDVSITGGIAGSQGVSALGTAAINAAKARRGDNNILGNIVEGFAGDAVGAGKFLAGSQGLAINPRIEVLFSNRVQREFRFDFTISPITEQETRAIHKIIYTLRRYSAPVRLDTTAAEGIVGFGLGLIGGFLWGAPAEFDIVFLHKGQENLAIPKINTCVLTQFNVDYAPNGKWATFTNGYPVQLRMEMTFRELEVLHRERVDQGF